MTRRRIPLGPVLERELRARARRKSMPRVASVFLVLAVMCAWLVWRSVRHDFADGASGLAAAPARSGRQVFEWTATTLFLMVSFLVPGFTAASISGERERQTLVPMQVSLLRPLDIVLGKMAASMATTVVLTLMAVPVLALGAAIGGVEALEVVRAVVGLEVVAVFWAALSVAASAIVRRTAAAMISSYALVGASTVITAIAAGVTSTKSLLMGNPFVGFADFVSPRDAVVRALIDFGPIGGTADAVTGGRVPYWIAVLVLYGALSAAAVWVAARRLRTPAMRER